MGAEEQVSKSSGAKGPDFRVLRPDLERERRMCRSKVSEINPDADIEAVAIPGNSHDVEDIPTSWIDPEIPVKIARM